MKHVKEKKSVFFLYLRSVKAVLDFSHTINSRVVT
jgi:hypothetical protein